jgi:hypothetical protein
MSVVHIFRIPQVVELTTATGAPLMNYPTNRTDFHLARYVDNEVEFWVKNIDRRAVPLTGSIATMHISDLKTGKVLLTRDLQIVDATKGLVRLTVGGDEVAVMPKGFHRYAVVLLRPDGAQVMLYTDRDRKGYGTVEVIDGPLPDPVEPTPLSLDDFITRSGKLYSTPVPGAAAVYNVSGQHSVVLHLSGFSGSFSVQGTLEPQPSQTDSQWFHVKTDEFMLATQVLHIPFEGNFMNVRFVVERTAGNIDLILFRN